VLLWSSPATTDKLGSCRSKEIPRDKILATKLDIKAAFRLCHLNALTAVQTCTQLPELHLALMMLRLSCGRAPCPLEFGTISESICDLINAILQHNNWDPLTLFAEKPQARVPPKNVLPDDVPFGMDETSSSTSRSMLGASLTCTSTTSSDSRSI